jgi:hypothetical protein
MKIKNFSHFFNTSWNRPLIASTIFFVVIFSIFTTIYTIADGDPVPDDHYFHFKYAYLLRTEGLDAVKNFDWIYLSGHADGGSRYAASLYQVSLIPFTYMSDWLFALHVADVFYGSVVLAIFYFIMRRERVKHPLFFAILLLSSTYMMSRLLLGRAFVLIVGMVFLEMYFAIHKRYIPLFFIVLIHVLWHQSTYFLPLIIVGIVEVCRYITDQKIFLRNIASTVIGIVVGMAFFPGFPQSIIGWLKGLFSIKNSGAETVSGSLTGIEMAPKSFMTYFASQEMILFLVLVPTIFVIGFYIESKKHERFLENAERVHMHWMYTLFVFLLFVIYGATAISGRFFDFVLPTAMILLSFVLTIVAQLKLISWNSFATKWCAIILWVWVGVLCSNSLLAIYTTAHTFDYRPAQRSSQWIADNSNPKEKVFLYNWSYFNLVFFTNSENIYSMGIEPTTLKWHDELLYWKYYNIFAYKYYCEKEQDCGEEYHQKMTMYQKDDATMARFEKTNSEKIITSIKNDFDARIIHSSSEEFSEVILRSPELIDQYYEIASDKYKGKHMHFTVFKLK